MRFRKSNFIEPAILRIGKNALRIIDIVCTNKSIMSDTKEYQTFDNGGRSFLVKVTGNEVSVHTWTGWCDVKRVNKFSSEPAYKYSAQKVFVGKTVDNAMTRFSGGHGPHFDGNSILVQLTDLTYVYIGNVLKTFTSIESIVEYISPVGNSGVPYPWATDETGNVYLMLDDVVILKGVGLSDDLASYDDPYDHYYRMSHVTPDICRHPTPTEPVLAEYASLKMWIGGDQYVMRYHAKCGDEYDRLTRDNTEKLELESIDTPRHVATQEEITSLLEKYANQIGVAPIKDLVLVQTEDV